jgi:hypothetical protein
LVLRLSPSLGLLRRFLPEERIAQAEHMEKYPQLPDIKEQALLSAEGQY